jgi:hypothetical protein
MGLQHGTFHHYMGKHGIIPHYHGKNPRVKAFSTDSSSAGQNFAWLAHHICEMGVYVLFSF